MSFVVKSIHDLIIRDLNKLSLEIKSYQNEADLWILSGDIKNSAGNICLHICGNLQHFIGTIMGSSEYIRHRDDEFNLKNVPKDELIKEIEQTKSVVTTTLNQLEEEKLNQNYPLEVFNEPISYISFLIHLTGHLNYHLGQINYHRRLK